MLTFFTFNHFSQFPSLLHKVTTKSPDLAYDFSLALHTGESPQKIRSNRDKLSQTFETDTPLFYSVAHQTHSENIKIITQKKTQGWHTQEDAIEDCDALITSLKGVVLSILTADCVPILLYDTQKEIIAGVHAGWRGTKAEIVAKTVIKMQEVYGSNPQDILAGIAPSIGHCCYEVGEEVVAHFEATPQSFTKQPQGKYKLDLPSLNKQQLLKAGLLAENIEMSDICTACEVQRFFSYRRENGCSGRFMSMIGMKP